MNNKLWNEFLNGEKIAIKCKPKETQDFLKLCEKEGLKWNSGDKPLKFTQYDYTKKTCYSNDNNIEVDSSNWYIKHGYKIVTYTKLMEDKKTFTGPELAQLLRDKKFKEGTKFCDEYGTIYSVVSLLTGFGIRHNGSPVNSYIIINGTFTLIEEPKFYFLNQAIKSNKQIKLKDWENYHDIEQALIHLSRLSKETIQEALTMQVWEVEE